ncbi:metal-dependent hydrolase [Desulfolithobacter dissulfuricans]|uniref:metal-dependent hydrolase n=1 Tax=Desulfolithobacter dissulfuricans TaxID=2795293 RepID=UPI0022794CEA|nr:metal-dependent hydrolase [Desulfolithobacter dissulfuricans]
MSRFGHKVSAGAIAATAFLMLSSLFSASMFAVGCLLGSLAPDWLEVAWFSKWFGRQSLVPHRTITHWPWPWIMALAALFFAPVDGPGFWLVAGFLAGGLLHLVLDLATPAGIPLGKPFGKKQSFSLYRTGGPGEIIVSVALWGLPAIILLVRIF